MRSAPEFEQDATPRAGHTSGRLHGSHQLQIGTIGARPGLRSERNNACLVAAMPTRMLRWSVYVIGGERTEFLGFVTGLDERRALAEAIRVSQVPADWQTRIIVSRLNIQWLRRLRTKR